MLLLYDNVNQLYVYIHISALSWTSLPPYPPSHPSRSPRSTELSSLGYIVDFSNHGSQFLQWRISCWPPVIVRPIYVSSIHWTQLQQEAKPIRFPLTSVHGMFQVDSFSGCDQTVLPWQHVLHCWILFSFALNEIKIIFNRKRSSFEEINFQK